MFGLDWGNPETLWLNVTNLALGLVVVAVVGVLASGVLSELPETARLCRHALTGEMPGRTCPLGFDCRECVTHARLIAESEIRAAGHELPEPAGLRIPADRFYHRGHT